ncbi:two-component sensor histidine kinase AdeS [Acinetobacter calcoaceticus]|uniref:two-component sensor histidine kinase AdeS n=1 Tax=Acinetobacter calcoaceticus TaxID=471 RepID=UPI002B2AE92F|nr:two-component sensor histidine kinase AdeS [Acinetobacter baumannii]
MKNKYGISKQLIITLSILNFSITVLTLIFGYSIYTIALKTKIVTWEMMSTSWPSLQVIDWIWYFLVLSMGFVLSIFLGMHLARRFVTPIESIAIATRKISQGDLGTRVIEPNNCSSEISELINNFNDMAQKLELSINNAHVWNAAIAHELRTPITILQGRLQGIVDEVFEPTPNLMKSLLAQVEGLSYLVEDLRTLSLMENQQLKLNIEATDFTDSIKKILLFFNEKLKASNLNIQTEISNDIVNCDVRRMEQVLIALIDNAVRYANAGTLKIKSYVDQREWILKIEDEGPGIPIEYQSELFKPFFRVEESRNKEFGGTGLGLAVVHAIVLAHEGEIQYENNEQKSIFTIKINNQF